MGERKYDIVIGVGSCDRPRMLKACLSSFTKMVLPSRLSVCMLLVDNHPSANAKEVYHKISDSLSFDSFYFHEPKAGIVYMRNRVLEEAEKLNPLYLGFVDDDEEVHEDWLVNHLDYLEQSGADVTAGGVDRVFEEELPKWIQAGKFLEKRQYETGMRKKDASTSNVFFRSKLFMEWGLRFNPRLSLTGSSDTYFFRQAYEKGAKILWLSEARVTERLPASKINLRWILNRSYRETNATIYRIRLARRGALAYLEAIWIAFNNLADGVIFLPFRLIKGKHKYVRSLVMFSRFAGTIAGIFGFYYKEYRTIHGD